jgi:hypothetical protein
MHIPVQYSREKQRTVLTASSDGGSSKVPHVSCGGRSEDRETDRHRQQGPLTLHICQAPSAPASIFRPRAPLSKGIPPQGSWEPWAAQGVGLELRTGRLAHSVRSQGLGGWAALSRPTAACHATMLATTTALHRTVALAAPVNSAFAPPLLSNTAPPQHQPSTSPAPPLRHCGPP